jgi:cardiolipin synthase A/B
MITGSASRPLLRTPADSPATMPADRAGFAAGINISPGSDDDGWMIPPPATLSDGTKIQLYKDGESLHAAYKAIEQARRRVCIEMYIFADDVTGNAFADLLARRAREGLRVYVIYDSFGSRGPFGGLTKPLRTMKEAGVRLQQFHPMRPWECQFSWHPVNRDHRKMFIADDEVAGMGGLNIGTEYAGSWIVSSAQGDFWRDNAIGISGPGVHLLHRAFRHTWDYVKRGGRMKKLAYAEHVDDDADFGLLASAPSMDSPFRKTIMRLLRSARRSVDLTMAYFAPDDELVHELCAAARRRRVQVRAVFPGVSDVPLVRLAGRGFYGTLLDCGVQIYERQHAILHAKTLCIDGHTTVIGSANLDYRSIEFNCELSAIVRSAEFGRQIEDLFENDVKYSHRISKAEWRALPAWDQFVQWTVSRARYAM